MTEVTTDPYINLRAFCSSEAYTELKEAVEDIEAEYVRDPSVSAHINCLATGLRNLLTVAGINTYSIPTTVPTE